MQKKIHILWDMQQISQQRAQLVASKKNLDSLEIKRLWHQINLLKQSVTADKESLLCLEKVCARHEADLEDASEMYAENEAKLNSGMITDARELEVLRQKCDYGKTDIEQRESTKAAGIDQCEKLRVNIIKHEQIIADSKQEHSRKQRQLVQALSVIDEKIYALDEQYKSLTARLDAVVLEKYRELEKQLMPPIAAKEAGLCSVCKNPLGMNAENLDSQGIERCAGCGRMLYREYGQNAVSG